MSERFLIGVDFGTSRIKTAAFDRTGILLGLTERPTPEERLAGQVVHAPEPVWHTVAGCLRELMDVVNGEPVAVGVAGVGEEGLPLDEAGHALYPAIAWFDPCTASQLERVQRVLGAETIYASTGLPPAFHYTLNKWAWLDQYHEDALRRARVWLPTVDYLVFRLTGACACAETQACRTMAYDLVRREWRAEFLHALGLRSHFLPEVVSAGSVVGRVSEEAGRVTGIPPGTPVTSAGHDHVVGAAAVGATHRVLDSCGSAETIVWPCLAPCLSEAGRSLGVQVGRHVVPDLFYASLAIPSGRVLNWARSLLGGWPEEAARLVSPGACGVKFVSSADGMRFRLEGLTVDSTPAMLARAIVEGLAGWGNEALGRVAEALGLAIPEEIILAGGLAQSRLWLEVKGAVSRSALWVPQVVETTALGAAMVAGVAAGWFPDVSAALDAVAGTGRRFVPDPGTPA